MVQLLSCLFLWIGLVASTDYYISSSKGSDSNSGTNEQSPWKTFKVFLHPYYIQSLLKQIQNNAEYINVLYINRTYQH